MQMEEKVETRIASLLALVVADDVDVECYNFVLKKLTRMAILGEAPPSSKPISEAQIPLDFSSRSGRPSVQLTAGENFSESKEKHIAP